MTLADRRREPRVQDVGEPSGRAGSTVLRPALIGLAALLAPALVAANVPAGFAPVAADLVGPLRALGSPLAPIVLSALAGGLGLVFGLGRLRRVGAAVAAAALVAAVLWLAADAARALSGGPAAGGAWVSLPAALAFATGMAVAGQVRALALPALFAAGLALLDRLWAGGGAPVAELAGGALGVLAGSVAGARAARWCGPADDRSPPSAAQGLLGLVLIAAPLLFFGLGVRHFTDPDEGRYAAIPYEMIARGDFVTPTLDHVLYFEKPPLLYWLVAAAFEVFGFHEGAARLVPAIAAGGGVAAAYWMGRRMFGSRAGVLSATVLATTLSWLVLGHYLVTDGVFTTLVFAALATWWSGHASRVSGECGAPSRSWWHDVAFWVLAGLAVLAKGPVALVLVFGTIGLYALVCRQWRDALRPGFLACSLVAVAIAAPWFVLVAERNPSFAHFFWIEQHLGRFLGTRDSGIHEASPWFFLPWIPVVLLPWTALLPAALATRGWRTWPITGERGRARAFLVCGFTFVLLFFSASTGKLITYIAPAVPLVCVGLGAWMASIEDAAPTADGGRALRHVSFGARAFGLLLIVGAVGGVVAGTAALREGESLGPGLALAFGALLAAWGVVLLVAAWRPSVRGVVAAVAGGNAALVLALLAAIPVVTPNHAFGALVEYIQPGLDAGADLVCYRGYIQSSSYYGRRRIRVYQGGGEMRWGLDQLPAEERELWTFQRPRDVAACLAAPGPVYCVVRDHERAREVTEWLGGGRVFEIVWNERRSIVGNAAAAALTPPLPGGLLGH